MALGTRAGRIGGAVIGGVLMVAAVVSVAMFDWQTEAAAPPPPIRPVKSMVIDLGQVTTGRQYPGRVRATEQVTLAFQVNGQIIELPVRNGQQVKRGDLLARLDPRDYQNALDAKQAQLTKAASDLEKLEKLLAVGAATQREVSDAKAANDVARADVEIARKALDDTRMLAPFDGTIANTLVDNFQNVQAKQDIVSLQDVTGVTIEVGVPEQRVIVAQRGRESERFRFVAVFDFLPGQEFDVTLREITTEADPVTQSYLATFEMPAPEDATILPGMTASILEYLLPAAAADDPDAGFAIPLSAAAIDGHGQYHVWRLSGGEGGLFAAHRVDVTVGPMTGNLVVVKQGLAAGDRIATAGVHLLSEGQQVRLYVPKAEARLGGEAAAP